MSTIEKINALRQLAEGINPTIIYNEGWMIRLLVIESMIEKLNVGWIDFELLTTKKWTSEAQISSPFEGAELKKHDKYEKKTHADIILGDFDINYEREKKRTEIMIKPHPRVLGIIEAKMGSGLSTGIKNASKYNQASRSICCLANVTKENPECEIFFAIVAPKTKINDQKSKFIDQIGAVKTEIEDRFKVAEKEYTSEMRKKVENCKRPIISYEDWIGKIKDNDVKEALNKFYAACKTYNNIKD